MVFCRGRVPADVLFIGEAPGAAEDLFGLPFKGPAGQLLDYIIDQAWNPVGFEKELSYALTNLVCCFPRDKKKTDNHAPPGACIDACQDRLEEFYDLVKPRLTVLVGSLAASSWPKSSKCVVDSCISIRHPAAILRIDIKHKTRLIQEAIATIQDSLREL